MSNVRFRRRWRRVYIIICLHGTFLRITEQYFYVKPNIRKYMEPFTSTNEATLIKLSKFVAIIMEKFSV